MIVSIYLNFRCFYFKPLFLQFQFFLSHFHFCFELFFQVNNSFLLLSAKVSIACCRICSLMFLFFSSFLDFIALNVLLNSLICNKISSRRTSNSVAYTCCIQFCSLFSSKSRYKFCSFISY